MLLNEDEENIIELTRLLIKSATNKKDMFRSSLTRMVDAITCLLTGKQINIMFTRKIARIMIDLLEKKIAEKGKDDKITYFSYSKFVDALILNNFNSSSDYGCFNLKINETGNIVEKGYGVTCSCCRDPCGKLYGEFYREKIDTTFMSVETYDNIFAHVDISIDDVYDSLVKCCVSSQSSLEKINKIVMIEFSVYVLNSPDCDKHPILRKLTNKCTYEELFKIKSEVIKIDDKCIFTFRTKYLNYRANVVREKYEKRHICNSKRKRVDDN